MEYDVSIEVTAPATGSLDPLQREGAASLLSRAIDDTSTDWPEDDHVQLLRSWIGTHADGALIHMAIEAPNPESAERVACAITLKALELTEFLADWTIATCEAELDEGVLTTGGATVAPGSPSVAATSFGSANDPESDDVDWGAWIVAHARHLRAFDLDLFNDNAPIALLAAGAIIFAAGLVIDELFGDAEELGEGHGTVAADGPFFVLDALPTRFAHRYDARFARRFMIATVAMASRLTQSSWTSPASVAEALALHLIVDRARSVLDEHALVDEGLEDLYNGFDDAAYDDVDHEWLYAMSMDGLEDDEELQARLRFTDMRFEAWFEQRPMSSSYVDPYALDIKPPPPADEYVGVLE